MTTKIFPSLTNIIHKTQQTNAYNWGTKAVGCAASHKETNGSLYLRMDTELNSTNISGVCQS